MKKINSKEATVEVLYQKLGNRWYAFSVVNDDVFVGSISQEEIDENSVPVEDSPLDPDLKPHL